MARFSRRQLREASVSPVPLPVLGGRGTCQGERADRNGFGAGAKPP